MLENHLVFQTLSNENVVAKFSFWNIVIPTHVNIITRNLWIKWNCNDHIEIDTIKYQVSYNLQYCYIFKYRTAGLLEMLIILVDFSSLTVLYRTECNFLGRG